MDELVATILMLQGSHFHEQQLQVVAGLFYLFLKYDFR